MEKIKNGITNTEIENRVINYKYLVARPVKKEEEEIKMLCKIAGGVNIGNSRPDYIDKHVKVSNETLSQHSKITLEQGIVFFATEFYVTTNKTPEIVGSCKLQHLFDACWSKEPRDKMDKSSGYISNTEILSYDSNKSHTIEVAGNAVLENFRGQGIGKFQTQARILYALIFGIVGYKNLVANLLTDSVNGKYPFYEHIVKPLLGKNISVNNTASDIADSDSQFLEYDDADSLRYKDVQFLNNLLGGTTRDAIKFPIHTLPQHIQDNFATVREITKRAQDVLERYGFQKLNKFDLLDGGQYIGTTYAQLKNKCNNYMRNRKLQSLATIPDEAHLYTFAPVGVKKHEFKAVRVRAIIDDDTLFIPEDVRHEVEIKRDSQVKVLLDREMT